MSDAQLTKVPGWGVEASPLRRDGLGQRDVPDPDEETDVEMMIIAREQYRGLGDPTVEHRPTAVLTIYLGSVNGTVGGASNLVQH